MNLKVIKIVLSHINKKMLFKIYGSEKSFLEHCKSHILAKGDFWSTLIEKDIADNAKSSIMVGNVNSEYVKELYALVVKIISEELSDSVKQPLYCSITSKNKKKKFALYYFLSSSGMRIVADSYCVRTGFFSASLSYSKSRVFERGCDCFVRKMIKARSLGKIVTQVSEKNWAKCSKTDVNKSKHYSFISGNTNPKTRRY